MQSWNIFRYAFVVEASKKTSLSALVLVTVAVERRNRRVVNSGSFQGHFVQSIPNHLYNEMTFTAMN
jgi:hypothetical protein